MFDQEALKRYVETSGDINKKQVGDDMFLLKYKKKVFYDNKWNVFTELCRGTIVDSDYNVVSFPITKIYNYGIEERAPKFDPDEDVWVQRKVNGFMVAITWHNNRLIVSTTGSTSGPFVDMAIEFITNEMRWRIARFPDLTFLFECVHPNDPHIIEEDVGLHFIGYRRKAWGSEFVAVGPDLNDSMVPGTIPIQVYKTKFSDLLLTVKSVSHEGFVFYSDDRKRAAKIKSPYYLMCKWLARNPNTDKIMSVKNDIKKQIDEEFYFVIDNIRCNIHDYTALDEQSRLVYIRKLIDERI